MRLTPTSVMAFLTANPEWQLERHEVAYAEFTRLKSLTARLIVALRETDDSESIELSDDLRRTLCEWLTVPIPFSEYSEASFRNLGDTFAIEARWGAAVARLRTEASDSLEQLRSLENPLRREIAQALACLARDRVDFRIYCHPAARIHYESMDPSALWSTSGQRFLHSPREYRDAAPFDVLVKSGPLRTRGWGSAPAAIISAPRFRSLFQFVWAGGRDEPGFGEDFIVANAPLDVEVNKSLDGIAHRTTMKWSRKVVSHGTPSDFEQERLTGQDDLAQLHALGRMTEPRRAVLLQIGEGLGVLYPRNAEPLFLHAKADHGEPLRRDQLAGLEADGLFLVWPDLGDVDLGHVNASEGSFSRIWKRCLDDALAKNRRKLLRDLEEAGVHLTGLENCVEHWKRSATTVIHAPQQRLHFERLIRVLGIEDDATRFPRPGRTGWWRLAWNEISRARSHAIQIGMQEQEIIDDELHQVLLSNLSRIRTRALDSEAFSFEIPDGESLAGKVLFLAVRRIDDGFQVPESSLRTLLYLRQVEEWRV